MTDETDGGAGAAVESTLRGSDIDHIFVEFADINGLSGSKQLQADYFLDSWRDGLAMNALLFVQTPRNDVPEDSGLGEAIDYGDAMVHPQPETFRRSPWRPDSARVLCSFEMDGEPVGAAPQHALQRVLDRQADPLDVEFTVGSELEFYLLTPTDGDGDGYESTTDWRGSRWSTNSPEVAPGSSRPLTARQRPVTAQFQR